jgi:hypothetical protein
MARLDLLDPPHRVGLVRAVGDARAPPPADLLVVNL